VSDSANLPPVLFEPSQLETAAAAFCQRFGEPGAEVQRQLSLRELLCVSGRLTGALEQFTRAATKHFGGVHCTADMRAEVAVVSRALAEWSDTVLAAADVHRDWQDARTRLESGQQVAAGVPTSLTNAAFRLGEPIARIGQLPQA
jgi:hypothetical protein